MRIPHRMVYRVVTLPLVFAAGFRRATCRVREGRPDMSQRRKDISIEAVHEPGRSRVIAAGEMDLACVVALNRAMSEATSRDLPVDLDLSAVTFVDSRFTAAVVGWERDLGADRLRLELPADDRLQRLLALRARKPSQFRARPAQRRA